jgi:hypothetical protein
MTIEFGKMSIGHLYSTDVDNLAADVNDVVKSLLAGHVREIVGL